MSAAANPPPQLLRPLVHEKIDQLTDVELAVVHKQLLMLELKRELDAIGEDMAKDWQEGRITREIVDRAILEHRAAHPYRTPVNP